MRPARNFAWPVLVFASVWGCAEPSSLSLAVEGAVDGAIVPAIEAFEADAGAFETSANAFCADPSEAELRATQDAWLRLMATWNRAGVYRMGPLYDDPIVPTIDLIESKRPRGTDYTQTVRETIAADLAADTTLDEAYFQGLNFNRGGMLALEVLLFEDGGDPASNAPADIVAAYADTRRCTYLQGTAEVLAERARGVATGWTERFGDGPQSFRDHVLSGVLPDGSEAAVAIVVVAIEHARYLSRRKLEGVPDVQLAQAARPEQSPFFGNLEIGVQEIDAIFAAETADGPSLYGVMEERGFSAEAQSLRAAIADALMWIQAGSEAGAIEALEEIDTVLVLFIPQALDITLPLNFNDGD